MQRLFEIVRLRLRTLMRRKKVEDELERELRFHLDRETQENIAGGMGPEEARRAALSKMGGRTRIEEECRDMRRTAWVETFGADLRYCFRGLRNSPGFATAMIVTLALGIGANSAIFGVIDGVLLRPLPYAEQNRIVRFFLSNASYPRFPVNAWDFLDFRARNRSFASMAVMTRSDMQLSGAGEPRRLSGFRVSAGYFGVLGVAPMLGREFETKDERPGNERQAILSARLWRAQFHSDPHILGRKIRLDGRPFTIVAVMPEAMRHPGNAYRPVSYGETVDFWWPFTFEGNPSRRGSHYIEGVGRLKPAVTAEAASAEMNSIMAQLAREHPDFDAGWRVLVVPLFTEITGGSRRMLMLLVGAVGLVLLIACANAANLLLARATGRRREIAVRLALGAARGRLIRQMLTESVAISVLGGAAGGLTAVLGLKALVALLPAGFPRGGDIHLNLAVLGFTIAVSLATGVVFGLAPAIQSTRSDLQAGLREGARGATGSARHLRLRSALVISEVSLACVLLTGAGLLLRSFLNLLRTDPGFRAGHVVTMSVSLPRETYPNGRAVMDFYSRFEARLRALPPVRASGLGSDLPWTGYDDNMGGWQIEGKQPPPHDEFHARYHVASPGYFQALGIPLVAGRFFTGADSAEAPKVLIVNRAMAERYWPGENVIGRRVNFDGDHPSEKDWTRIVGVVGDVKDSPEKPAAEPAFWWPMEQTQGFLREMTIAVRTDNDPPPVVGAIRRVVSDLDPSLALADVRTMDDIAEAGIAAPRFTLFLVALFAALAIALAGIGAYSVIAYSVNQRAAEFGMRMALGARPWDVMRLVLGHGLRLAAVGVGAGMAAGLALSRLLRSLLYEVSPVDPATYFLVALFALAIAALACYLPARRATLADPASALRAE